MKMLHCDSERDAMQKTIYQCGDFSYEYIADYAKGLPVNVAKASIAGGCTDPEGNLYLGMRGDPSQVVMLDPEGNFLKCFGEGLFGNYLHFMKFTPQGTLLCTDTHHHIVREFTTEGKLVRDFGNFNQPSNTGMDMGYYPRTRRQAIFPTEMYFGMPGMWMMYEAMHRIDKVAGPFNMPTDVDMTSKGEYIFADGYGNRAVHRFNANGEYEKTWGGIGVWDVETDTPGKFLVVHALCVDSRDQIWVCDREKDAIHVFDRDGNVLGYCSRNMGQPSGIDTDGVYVYVVGRGGYLTIFDMDLNIVGQLGTFNCDLRAHDLCADREGNLYLFPTHANEDHQVIKLKRMR